MWIKCLVCTHSRASGGGGSGELESREGAMLRVGQGRGAGGTGDRQAGIGGQTGAEVSCMMGGVVGMAWTRQNGATRAGAAAAGALGARAVLRAETDAAASSTARGSPGQASGAGLPARRGGSAGQIPVARPQCTRAAARHLCAAHVG